MQRLEVAQIIRAAPGDRFDMIDLPAEVGGHAVGVPVNGRSALVFGVAGSPRDGSRLTPYCFDRGFREGAPRFCGAMFSFHFNGSFSLNGPLTGLTKNTTFPTSHRRTSFVLKPANGPQHSEQFRDAGFFVWAHRELVKFFGRLLLQSGSNIPT